MAEIVADFFFHVRFHPLNLLDGLLVATKTMVSACQPPRRTVEDQLRWRAALDQRNEQRRLEYQAAQRPTRPHVSERSRALAGSRGWSKVPVATRLVAQARESALAYSGVAQGRGEGVGSRAE